MKYTVEEQGRQAKNAAPALASSSGEQRSEVLGNIREALFAGQDDILRANKKDVLNSRAKSKGEQFIERMTLSPKRISDMVDAVRVIEELPDPVGEVIQESVTSNGMLVQQIRTPLGVLGIIFESRPNVAIDAAALCIKSGNALLMRGGSETVNTNGLLIDIARSALVSSGLPADAIQFVASKNRADVGRILKMSQYIDMVIPRGSSSLVHMVAENATMPAIIGGIGVCHTYVDKDADIDMAVEIVHNAKAQRHTVCNALDTVLVHSAVTPVFIPKLTDRFAKSGVEMRMDESAIRFAKPFPPEANIKLAGDSDFGCEFLALTASVKTVDSVEQAIEHIARHGSGHSEAIVTADADTADCFLRKIDAAAVFHNVSTRFNDGGEFGLGAEMAISTSKLHARGPMGLKEICSYKWVVKGKGQIRT